MFLITQAELAHLKSGSSVINSASINSNHPAPQLVSYAATKAAIVNFTQSTAALLAPRGIRVNCVPAFGHRHRRARQRGRTRLRGGDHCPPDRSAATRRQLFPPCKIPDRLAPYLKTWDRSFKDWGASAIGPDAAGFYTLTRPGDASDTDIIQPKGRRFASRVTVLVGPKNASATFGFAGLMQRQRLGTLVGEQTGGNRRGINGGAFFFVGLPASGVEVDLPLIAYWPETPQPDAGIMPDITVPARIADIQAERDTALMRAVVVVSGTISLPDWERHTRRTGPSRLDGNLGIRGFSPSSPIALCRESVRPAGSSRPFDVRRQARCSVVSG